MDEEKQEQTLEERAEELGVTVPTRKEVDRYRRLRTIDDYDTAYAQMLTERIACAEHQMPKAELDLSPENPDDPLGRIMRAEYQGRRA
jgi:hypothetical protein